MLNCLMSLQVWIKSALEEILTSCHPVTVAILYDPYYLPYTSYIAKDLRNICRICLKTTEV